MENYFLIRQFEYINNDVGYHNNYEPALEEAIEKAINHLVNA